MMIFRGRMGKRLPDRDGHVRYVFDHNSGARLELRMTQRQTPALEHKRVLAKGELMPPATLVAEEVQLDLNFSDTDPNLFGD